MENPVSLPYFFTYVFSGPRPLFIHIFCFVFDTGKVFPAAAIPSFSTDCVYIWINVCFREALSANCTDHFIGCVFYCYYCNIMMTNTMTVYITTFLIIFVVIIIIIIIIIIITVVVCYIHPGFYTLHL